MKQTYWFRAWSSIEDQTKHAPIDILILASSRAEAWKFFRAGVNHKLDIEYCGPVLKKEDLNSLL